MIFLFVLCCSWKATDLVNWSIARLSRVMACFRSWNEAKVLYIVDGDVAFKASHTLAKTYLVTHFLGDGFKKALQCVRDHQTAAIRNFHPQIDSIVAVQDKAKMMNEVFADGDALDLVQSVLDLSMLLVDGLKPVLADLASFQVSLEVDLANLIATLQQDDTSIRSYNMYLQGFSEMFDVCKDKYRQSAAASIRE